jgi:hypothetical protein
MTWRLPPLPPVPKATAAVVQAAFPTGNLSMALRMELGTRYEQDRLADLYAYRVSRCHFCVGMHLRVR